jgi:CRISPR/Cas system-associated exonuclease Cas4 (RecB family)
MSHFNFLKDFSELLAEKQSPRGYIGCSIIGHSCERYIWLNKYGAPLENELPWGLSRTFKRGKIEEERLMEAFADGRHDWRVVKQEMPLQERSLKGRLDALVEHPDHPPFVLEIKTMNEKNYKAFVKHGVKVSHFTYWAQCQTYMRLSRIHHCALVAANKNNDHQLHLEVIDYDPDAAEAFVNRACRIDNMPTAPRGLLALNKKDPKCFGCAFKKYCYRKKGTNNA